MHYSMFIKPGAKRIEATPGFSEVQVSAFVNQDNNDVAIVALNSSEQKHELNINFKNLEGIASLKVFRTSSTENMAEIDDIMRNTQSMGHSFSIQNPVKATAPASGLRTFQ